MSNEPESMFVKAPEEATLLLVSLEVKDSKEENRIIGIDLSKSSGGGYMIVGIIGGQRFEGGEPDSRNRCW